MVDLLADVYFEAGEFESSIELAAHWDVGDWYLDRLNQAVEDIRRIQSRAIGSEFPPLGRDLH